jgi:hypothetical protein
MPDEMRGAIKTAEALCPMVWRIAGAAAGPGGNERGPAATYPAA